MYIYNLNITSPQTACGTVYYVAPELRSKTRIKHGSTNRVDSFGVGAVLYYWYAAHFLSSLFRLLTSALRTMKFDFVLAFYSCDACGEGHGHGQSHYFQEARPDRPANPRGQ